MAPAAGPGVVSTDVLATLKRLDGDVEEVLASSGHVSLYTMAVESQQWMRKNVEGSLFLLKRRSAPRFQMMVLNKMSTENYVEDIHAGLDFELNSPYLMYTHGNSEIIGVWFYEPDDLRKIEEVLNRIKLANQAAQPAPAVRTQAPARPSGGRQVDDDNFWDKPSSGAATATPSAQRPAASAVSGTGDGGSNNLANLLRNAQLKQQQQLQQAATEQPQPQVSTASLNQPLPPSFFAQQQQRAQPAASHAASVPATASQAAAFSPAPAAPAAPSQPTPSSHPSQRAAQAAAGAASPAAAAAEPPVLQQPPGPQVGGTLAKLFANAHKPAPTAAAAAPPQAPAPVAPSPATPVSGPPQPPQLQPQQQRAVQSAAAGTGLSPGGGGGGGVSDEERVRRLLARIATNEGLLKMLAAEMRAVGLL